MIILDLVDPFITDSKGRRGIDRWMEIRGFNDLKAAGIAEKLLYKDMYIRQ